MGPPGIPGQNGAPGNPGRRGQCEDCTIYTQPAPQVFFPAPAPAPSYGDCGTNTAYEFRNQRIVTDILDEGPQCRLPVEYSPNIDRYAFGIQAKYTDILSEPTAVEISRSSTDYYTLVMLDLDAPSTSDWRYRSAVHWLVVNIRNGDWRSGYTVASYQGLSLEAGNNGHRVAYLVFRQEQGMISVREQYWSLESRYSFDLRSFIRTYNLYYIPLQGNYFIINYN